MLFGKSISDRKIFFKNRNRPFLLLKDGKSNPQSYFSHNIIDEKSFLVNSFNEKYPHRM